MKCFGNCKEDLGMTPLQRIQSLDQIKALDTIQDTFDATGKENPSLQAIYQYQDSVFIFDNHHHALSLRATYLIDTRQHLPVIHIDQHSDMARPQGRDPTTIPHTTLQDRRRITYEITDIGSFIIPALEGGLISDCFQLRSETALLEFVIPQTPYIVDIDLDFWAPEMINDHVSQTLEKTRDLITNASLVTIATSPGYINQGLALKILGKLID